MKVKGREGSPRELAGHDSPLQEWVMALVQWWWLGWDQPSWPRSQQENSSKNRGSEKTKEEKRSREESQTRGRGKAMEIWEGP